MPRAARYVALARAIALGSSLPPSLDASSSESLAGALTFPDLDDNRLFVA